ncbi:phosphoribosylformylglycinamidine cyclo-ligase [Leuconostoc mesenteroides]|uniref:phosphoribosylformylglycinamidine cyclo-ligase n=1 Tax=Leuconostoc mesenteroides TaxID=1245 RepID=UPI002360F4C7|nr:phosphoribosylformylglycinamidine cyclo-ligase [Leuconostoc mesenteroides]
MSEKNAYQKAGVDIKAGERAVDLMKDAVADTYNDQVLDGIGGFGAAFALGKGYTDPVLISGADGVGTKLLLAIAADKHDTIGQDLVAMAANDILAQGAKPAFLLDYLAVDKMRPEVVAEIVTGIAKAAKASNMSLIGGESAELPGLYAEKHYDLAAFAVGIAERQQLLSAKNVSEGDVLIGLPSSGIHSNGYSLVRQVFGVQSDDDFNQLSPETKATLLTPTALYAQSVWPVVAANLVQSMAHITGGGIIENLPRALPDNVSAEISWGSWPILPIFHELQAKGHLSLEDMLLTFNNGLGMILIVKPQQLADAMTLLTHQNQTAYVLGKITPAQNDRVVFTGNEPW